MRILYLVSTLRSSGPTNQLYNIASNLAPDVEKLVVTLSPEVTDSQWERFESLRIPLRSLGLSRLQGVLYAEKNLADVLADYRPDIVHSQGLRADALMASMEGGWRWVMTARNYPLDDYPMKFGRLRGWFMARKHLSCMARCQHLIACSRTIAKQLAAHGLDAYPIQNGVAVERFMGGGRRSSLLADLPRPIFVTVGSLIHRKNNEMLVRAFNGRAREAPGSLVVIGDGPGRSRLQQLSIGASNVVFTGSVSDIESYLPWCDYFVSCSLSEGLPNTVLEALAAGLPCLLSDIPSHREIWEEGPGCVQIFDLNSGEPGLREALETADSRFDVSAREDAQHLAQQTFSAGVMSAKYEQLYRSAHVF